MIDHKTQDEWEIQLTMKINFISSKDSKETRTMHTTSDIIEIMIGNETDEIIEELFESLLQKYQEGLENSMKGSEIAFDSNDLLYYKLHKISLNRVGLYIDFPEWLKNKKALINPINKKDDKCFQYAVTVALNHEQMKTNPQRISIKKLFIGQNNWKEIEFPSYMNDFKKFEKKQQVSSS